MGKIKYIDDAYSAEIADYIKQLKILLETMRKLHSECGSIFPGALHLYNAIEEVKNILRDIIIEASGLEEAIKKELGSGNYELYSQINKNFEKKLKEVQDDREKE